MAYFRVQIGLSGRYRTCKPKFLSRESAERWVEKFYPTRAFRIVEEA